MEVVLKVPPYQEKLLNLQEIEETLYFTLLSSCLIEEVWLH